MKVIKKAGSRSRAGGWFNRYRVARIKRSITQETFRFFMLALGAIISGIATAIFYVPYHIAPGGLNTIGIVLNDAFGFQVGIAYVLMNLPFFIWSLRIIGYRYLIRVGFVITVFILAVDFTPVLLGSNMNAIPEFNLILVAVFGGALSGFGVGLVYRFGASTGGTDIISQLINFSTRIPYGTAVLVVDSFMILILTTYFIFFGEAIDLTRIELAMYSGIALFVHSRVIDTVQSGMTATKMVIIITNNVEPVRKAILHRIDRGVTIVEGLGGYSLEKRNMIFCAIPRSQISRLKEIVTYFDKSAFIMVTTLSETKGKGFEKCLPK
jgi:uncharacterized membrane-anchored protein YitT (DUF2179 family)